MENDADREREMDLREFVKRCKSSSVKKILKEQRQPDWYTRKSLEVGEPISTIYGRENREKRIASQKIYAATEKGREARLRVNCTRVKRYREAMKLLTSEEIEQVKEFYVNRPSGHHVDHIIPLSKGGTHHRSNLQYLPAAENFKKNAWVSAEALWNYRHRLMSI